MSNLTEDRIAEFREAFEIFDKDQDGAITIDELADLLRALGYPPSEQEINNMKTECDIDQNGNIDFREFITLIARRVRDSDLEEEMIEVFKIFNKKGDGLISREELKRIMDVIGEKTVGEKPTDEEIDKMMLDADLDQDGCINYDEFCRVISEH